MQLFSMITYRILFSNKPRAAARGLLFQEDLYEKII